MYKARDLRVAVMRKALENIYRNDSFLPLVGAGIAIAHLFAKRTQSEINRCPNNEPNLEEENQLKNDVPQFRLRNQ